MLRSILHCDMNNFYASVECMLDPALKKYPIAVCGSVEERHGIVLAKNYKAKAFDVKTGDAVWQAKQKCKDLVVVPPHYEEYIKYSSITYKLKWNGGDMKSVQGDSGHARMDMVADVYSHIIDEDRRYNAQKFEEQFYNAKGLKNAEEGKTAPMPKFETSVELLDPMAEVQKESEVEKEKPAENSTDENAALLTKLLSNPETAALLKALAKTI